MSTPQTEKKITGSKQTLQFIPDWAEFGEASLDELLVGAPRIEEFPTEGITFPNARFLQVIYEIDMFSSAGFLPPSLAPVRGSHFVMFRAHHLPETPWGPTTITEVGTLCRFGYRPRVFQLAAKVDNPAAVEPLRSGWGYPVSLADRVNLRRYHDGSHLTVTQDGVDILKIQTTRPILTAGGSLGINSSVHLADTVQGPRIVQVAEDFTFKASEVSTPQVKVFDSAAWGLSGLNANYPVSAVSAVADITLRPIQFVSDADKPALLNIRPVSEL
ncbi:hypothetical protein ASD65_10025 [Microbacterium sp. Root61]|uniref:acetoacetate decarboxylase family protein n=1 Tax=Microbacterium sp. Root61 TaxID=1736570 RepID=UPI0006F6C6A7|nr:acetoacetate decarboxylase family protein [Microbacterium sp. Root61]KRA24717.1 hypothetical protein ASD65_10025 [Microbacterium sp. Root61]